MRKLLIVGNWKMHLNASQASLLLHRLQENIKIYRDIEVVLAPSMLVLQPLSVNLDRRKFKLAAQNAYFKDEGAYTGEVSFTMLRDLAHYVIIGHSERRHIFGEDLPMVRDKVAACIRNGITPLLCVGETKQDKDDGETKQVLHDQLMTALNNLTAEEVGQMVIAYEPVWAISNGSNYEHHEIPKPDEVKSAVDYIRNYVKDIFGADAAEQLRVIYGGSTTADMVPGYLGVGIDGFLPGASSLNYRAFTGIVEACLHWQRQAE
jgi:triosephosphate isomerase